jgi:hypothetical protein
MELGTQAVIDAKAKVEDVRAKFGRSRRIKIFERSSKDYILKKAKVYRNQ